MENKQKAVEQELKELVQKYNVLYKSQLYAAWNRGTIQSVWALLAIMDKKKVEQHFLAAKEEYPIRIILVGDGELFDIVYIAEEDIQLTNNLFSRRKIDGCGHIVVVEKPEHIADIQIPDSRCCRLLHGKGGWEHRILS